MTHDSSDSPFVQIHLRDNHVLIVDHVDSDLVNFNWVLRRSPKNRNLYAQFNIRGVLYVAHRLIMERILGRPLLGDELVDHENQNGLDNRRENLRLATKIQNGQNRRINKNNKSGYKGVSYYKSRDLWRASITIDRKNKTIGYYHSRESAARAYNATAREHFGEFACLNDVPDGPIEKVNFKIGRPRKS